MKNKFGKFKKLVAFSLVVCVTVAFLYSLSVQKDLQYRIDMEYAEMTIDNAFSSEFEVYSNIVSSEVVFASTGSTRALDYKIEQDFASILASVSENPK